MASNYIDGTHLLKTFLPRVNQYISSASFARGRFHVQRVFVCAAVISQDEAVIHDLLKKMPSWSTTQDALDWQPEEDRRSSGDVYQHLLAMSSARDCPKPDEYLFNEVESTSNTTISICSHSFRLSTLEVCNAETPKGYHFGATALERLQGFENHPDECEKWRKLLLEYIVKKDDDSPYIVWGGPRVATAVVWQVQLDLVDTLDSFRRSGERKRRRSGLMAQVPAPAHKRIQSHDSCKSKYTGVRHRDDRGPTCVWTAETRLPKAENMRNKVSFGDYKSDYEAARAIDAAYYYYRKDRCNFSDSPEHLQTQPSLDGLEGKEKLKAVKDRAKWLAANAPLPSTSPPSSPIPIAESIASPGFSRSNSANSDESAVDGIILDHMIDNPLEPFELNEAVDGIILDHIDLLEPFELIQAEDDDDQYEERTQSSFGDEMSWIFDELPSTPSSIATFMQRSTALFPQYGQYCNNMGDWVDASATQSTSQASQLSIVAGSRL